jgi:hypothetical protein
LVIRLVFATPNLVVLVDRSYCPLNQWQQVTQTYQTLYRQHQQQRLHLQTIILFSNLGQEVLSPPPAPAVIQNLSTYGRPDPQRQAELQKAYPKAHLLSCHS